MIEQIHIKNLGIIGEAKLELGTGFSVLTGETGAGKTMVITALNLLLGARADANSVQKDAKQATVEGTLLLDAKNKAIEKAQKIGVEPENVDNQTEIILTRTINSAGRSKAYVCARTVPVNVLNELATYLVAVHGQSEQLRLKDTKQQQQALDRFAGKILETKQKKYSQLYQKWCADKEQLKTLEQNSQQQKHEIAYLQTVLKEIETVQAQKGEDIQLQVQTQKLQHLEALREAANDAYQNLSAEVFSDSKDALTLVGQAQKSLSRVAQYDQVLESLAKQLENVTFLLTDVVAEISAYLHSLEPNTAEQLGELEQRRAVLTNLVRKYGQDLAKNGIKTQDINGILLWQQQIQDRLGEINFDPDLFEKKCQQIVEQEKQLWEFAAEISKIRVEAAEKFSQQVTLELAGLAMLEAQLQVEVTVLDSLTVWGADRVEFLFKPHVGSVYRPLAKGASGGELSRVMLAVEVVLAGKDPVPTFVFDEIDSGVGGKAATEIGKRLARLAKSSQVIVVTHLPQVAAFAQTHLQVTKFSDGQSLVTTSGVQVLSAKQRVGELARMLAGQENSVVAQAHARELLEKAASEIASF